MTYERMKQEILQLISRETLDSMMTPITEGKKLDGTAMSLSELANYNALVAMNNEGARALAEQLRDSVTGFFEEWKINDE